jgi:integrase
MRRAGIREEGRKLTVHSLRYTYNTKMETLLSEERLLQFMGHESRQMTLHYSRPYWQERLLAYQGDKENVERFWG